MHIVEHIKALYNTIDRQKTMILAVSKTQSTEHILEAYHAGISNFGENYLQEAIAKIEILKDYPLTWHYIGHMQSNKCKKIAQFFSWVHTLDRCDIAQKLNTTCIELEKTLNVCIQVNLFAEPQKSGIAPADINKLIQAMASLPHLNLRGLMTILPESLNAHEQVHAYQKLAQLKSDLNQTYHLNMDTLSMGMSGDYLLAIQAGSTIIRLGQAIFGARPKRG